MNADPWPEIEVTKLDAARRQLETAITLLFEAGDAVSVHTLAHASYGVLKDVANHRNQRRVLDTADELAARDPNFWKDFNYAGNFYKHADKGPNATLTDIPEEVNEALISLAVEIYRDLGCLVTPEIESFYLWWRCIHFRGIDDVKEPFISWLKENSDRLHCENRVDLLELGHGLLKLLKQSGQDVYARERG